MLKHFTIRILLSMFLLVSVERTYAATPISDMRVDINTKGGAKDLDGPINIQILKDETAVLYDSGWISERERQFRKIKEWRAPGPGHPIRFPILLDDCSKLKFRVEKVGDMAWEVSFRVRANNDQVVLVTDTPIVLFGKKNPIRVEKPLEGPGGIKAQHLNGGNFHVFGFTCHP